MSTDSADGNYKISIFKIIKHIRDIIKHERKRKTIKDPKKKKTVSKDQADLRGRKKQTEFYMSIEIKKNTHWVKLQIRYR